VTEKDEKMGDEDEDEKMSYEEEERSDADEETSNGDDEELSDDDDDEGMSDEDDADADPDPINAEELAGLPREALVARLVASEQGRLEAVQRIRGTYYSPIDQMWKGEGRHIRRADSHVFGILKRTRAPSFVSPNGANYYDETISKARLRAFKPARKPRPSIDTAAGRAIWPRDIFATHHLFAQVAHLVPDSNDHAAAHYDVAICALAPRRAQQLGDDPKGHPRGRAAPAGGASDPCRGRRDWLEAAAATHRHQAQRAQHDPPLGPGGRLRPAPLRSHRSHYDPGRGEELERRRLRGDRHGGTAPGQNLG
jgi:hypothetical protein